jgi:hypothetical protein
MVEYPWVSLFENKRIHPLILDNSFDKESAVVSSGTGGSYSYAASNHL